jgi:parallel beta-helix repeat protein
VSISYAANRAARPKKKAIYAENRIIVKFPSPAQNEGFSQGNDSLEAGVFPKSVELLNKMHGLKSSRPVFRNFRKNRNRLKELLSRDKKLLTQQEKKRLEKRNRAEKNVSVPALDTIYILEFDNTSGKSIADIIEQYSNCPDVEYAEPDYIISLDYVPNDPHFGFQWGLHNTGQMYPTEGRFTLPPGTPDADIDAREAWDVYFPRPSVVAVIDTGVDYTHRDLANVIWINEDEIPDNEIDDDDNGFVDDVYGYDFLNIDNDPIDDHGHGTHCAGIIGAERNNGLDISGVHPGARIMALKFLDSFGDGFMSDAVIAFYYAVENGADVLSNSWGGEFPLHTLELAIEYAHSQGVITVAAAGNENTTILLYPAVYNNVISVAATDSTDNRASFSNYGDLVDIAAPGVDILSLRAAGTSMGAVYDDYTTVASGSSMACPFVAAVCAMMVSIDPENSDPNRIEEILKTTVDPISPEICVSGRINAHKALLKTAVYRGYLYLDKEVYSCNDNVEIELHEADPVVAASYPVTITTEKGDHETIELYETETPNIFRAAIPTRTDPNDGSQITGNGFLELLDGNSFTVTYIDANDGLGNPAIVEASGYADCVFPEVTYVTADIPGPEPKVSFAATEQTTARLLLSNSCGGPSVIELEETSFKDEHSFTISPIAPYTDFYFMIEVSDIAGNTTIEDNNGLCYSFTTDGPNEVIYVPTDEATIQKAINRAWPGGTVCVKDGVYTGTGNVNIDFKGRAITLKSENGPENCTIDCQSHGRAFYFHNNEDNNSVVEGFKIINANDNNGAVYCDNSSPTIRNCVFENNAGKFAAAAYFYNVDGAVLTHCFIVDSKVAPAIACRFSDDVLISNTVITRTLNYKTPGGALHSYNSTANLLNCTITENVAKGTGGAILCEYGSGIDIANSIIWQNSPDQFSIDSDASISANYSNIQGGFDGQGNVDTDPLFWKPDWMDYRLRWNPACVDAGTDSVDGGLPATDLDGNSRLFDGDWDGQAKVDMGAYEYRANEIQNAINKASDGDIVIIKPGTYHGSIRFEGKDITIRSRKAKKSDKVTPTVIAGTPGRAAVTFADRESQKCLLEGFTITGGQQGILCYASSPTISNCQIGDYPDIAAELWHESEPEFTKTTINGDVVTRPIVENITQATTYDFLQPAVDQASNADVIVVNPGICPDNVTITSKNIIIRSIDPNDPDIVSNTVIDGRGGDYVITNNGQAVSLLRGLTIENAIRGIRILKSNPSILNCIVRNNQISGIYVTDRSNPLIKNCLITENQQNGIEIFGGAPRITNCTIVGNRSAGVFAEFGTELITNSIIWDSNSNQFHAGKISYSDIQGGADGIGNIDTEPGFVKAGYWGHGENPAVMTEPNDPNAVWYPGDYHLSESLPGDPNYIPAAGETDLDGNPRVIGGLIDMGVYEYYPPIKVDLQILPKKISCRNSNSRLTARMILPAGFSPQDVDTTSPAILLPTGIESISIKAFYNDTGLVVVNAVFETALLCEYSSQANEVELTVTGSLSSRQKFTGSTIVQIK